MRTRAAGRRPAFSLLDMCGFMAALALALSLLLVVLAGALRLEAASAGVLRQLGAQRELADQFRQDVARATEAPQRWNEAKASATCLILRQSKDRHIVYRVDANRLVRSEHVGERVQQRPMALGRGQVAVEFVRPAEGGRLFAVRVSSIPKAGNTEFVTEIAATLGGDLQ